VTWRWLAGDGDAIDLRVEVLILVVGENLTKEENESVKTAVQLNVSTGAAQSVAQRWVLIYLS
jgi:hypothetical protein